MIKFRLIFSFLLLMVGFSAFCVPFTAGNIVVLRVGTIGATSALTSAATAVYLDEYTTAGVFVQTLALPTAVPTGSNLRITNTGNATSEGSINLSSDRNYLTVAGYDAAVGTTGINISTSTANNRVVGIIDASGNINSTTALTDAYTGANIRGAMMNGTDIWLTGSSGIRYATKGATTSISLATAPASTRCIGIYNNQLYCTAGTSGYVGINTIGSGMPISGTQTVTLLPGFSVNPGTPSPYPFDMKPTTGDIAYVADDRASGSLGGIQKWTLTGGTWSLIYTLNPATATIGARGVTVDWNSGTANFTMYVTGTDNRLYKIVDGGAGGNAGSTLLTTGSTNTAFRGIAFAPGTLLLPITLSSFSGVKTAASNLISWATANAQNFSHFELERKTDGRNFSQIATFQPNAAGSYSYADNQPLAVNYYRLKMVDKDGTASYSKVVAIVNASQGFAVSNVYPTLTTGLVTVEAFAAAATKINCSVINMAGQQVLAQTYTADQSFKQTIDISSLAKGSYILKLFTESGQSTFKLVKQ